MLDMYDELKRLEKELDSKHNELDDLAHDRYQLKKKCESYKAAIIHKFCEEYDPEYGRR